MRNRRITTVLLALALGSAACGADDVPIQRAELQPVSQSTTISAVAAAPVAPVVSEASSTPDEVQETPEITPTTEPAPPTTEPAPVTVPRVPRTTPTLPSPRPVETSSSCGGSLPPCWVLARESHGDPAVWNGGCYDGPCAGGSMASGLWQFMPGTWAGYGGYRYAADAPVATQNERARQVWAGGAGCSHWSAC